MSNDLTTLCALANRNKHRKKLPGYEESHVFYPSSTGYIHFINQKLPKDKELTGWKFIISLDQDDVTQAWLLVQDILLSEQGAWAFKVLDILRCQECDYIKRGEQIVLYAFKSPTKAHIQSPRDIFDLLVRIEKVLRFYKIRTGIPAEANLKITGSRYISMRNDRDSCLGYISSTDALAINPQCSHNPFQYENPYHWFAMSQIRHRFFSRPGFGFYAETDSCQRSTVEKKIR